ncbi:hypothetical protein LRP49_17470 [Enterovibrio sp. ZSDZ35]|uniref:Phage integrase family protein n=1 Tax=Enterovibrio qingdaonensis TaxID=2899818 RepID=A0ABT5QPP9_9GAMM|nr:hypothetical protein [Enterovibrio sp. ZSDZ35]MDD1782965.1 hypothetical protein [Enterovibrio sp. ZSDZ35]
MWFINDGSDAENLPYISFDDYIPATGGTLRDEKYLIVTNAIKKVLALSRTGHLATEDGGKTLLTRFASMVENATALKTLAIFLIKEYGEDAVCKEGFSLLTTSDIKKFHLEIATGRADKATGFTELILNKISLMDSETITHLFGVNSDDEAELSIGRFLEKLGVSKVRVSSFTRHLISEKLNELFPDLPLAITVRSNRKVTEFPNSCPMSFTGKEATVGDNTFDCLIKAPNLLKRYSHYLPELVNYCNPTVTVTESFANTYIRPKERTPNIPTQTALYYLDEAIRIVTVYGEDIVETKKNCEFQLNRIHKENPKFRRDYIFEGRCPHKVVIPDNGFTRDFKVTRYNDLPTGSSPKELRENVTVLFGYKMLLAATYILAHTFCIKRVSEILELKESSLEHGLWGGYELFFGIRKSAPTDNSTLVTGRPIPHVLFEGITCLAEANSHYYAEHEDPFLFPSNHTSTGKGGFPKNQKMNRAKITGYLQAFADFIQVPTEIVNGVESRFYLTRTHVLRRFAARAFYALSDISDFPALSWLMGHRSTEETWHYLLEEVGNEHLSEEEAQCVLDAIYKSNVDTSQVEDTIKSNLNIMFNNQSDDVAREFIREQILSGAKIYNYTDASGKVILWMDISDEETSE